MPLLSSVGCVKVRRWLLGSVVLLAACVLRVLPAQASQDTPPISGVTGTTALEGTMKKFYRAANMIVVTTIDGVEHVFHYTKGLLVHGGKGSGVEALQGLGESTTVVVHYAVAGSDASAQEIDQIGSEGLSVTEGVVIHVDRGRKRITVRFDNGHTETFQLTDRAAVDAGRDLDQAAPGTTKVTVYYSDEGGRKVAHFFKKTS